MSSLPWLDWHVHSAASDGQGSLEEIALRAGAKGLAAVAITDHYDPFAPTYAHLAEGCLKGILQARDRLATFGAASATVPERLSDKRSRRPDEGPLVFVGLERGPHPLPGVPTGIFPIIGSVHYLTVPWLTVPGEPTSAVPSRPGRDLFDAGYWRLYQEEVLRLAEDPQLHILGHPAGYLPLDPLLPPSSTYAERRAWEKEIAARFFSRDWYEALFRRAARSGLAVELHCATRTPEPDAVCLGLRLGVKFSLGSDAHSLDRVGDVGWGVDLLESLGASPADLFNPIRR